MTLNRTYDSAICQNLLLTEKYALHCTMTTSDFQSSLQQADHSTLIYLEAVYVKTEGQVLCGLRKFARLPNV